MPQIVARTSEAHEAFNWPIGVEPSTWKTPIGVPASRSDLSVPSRAWSLALLQTRPDLKNLVSALPATRWAARLVRVPGRPVRSRQLVRDGGDGHAIRSMLQENGESCRVARRLRLGLSTDGLYALRSAAVMDTGVCVCVGSTRCLAEDLARAA